MTGISFHLVPRGHDYLFLLAALAFVAYSIGFWHTNRERGILFLISAATVVVLAAIDPKPFF